MQARHVGMLCEVRRQLDAPAGQHVERAARRPAAPTHSENATALRGSVSEASTTTVLPETSGGITAVTKPSSDGSSAASTATTPIGSGRA